MPHCILGEAMNDTRITIIGGTCTVTTSDGQSIAGKRDIERFDAAVSQGRLLRFSYGGVIWYESVNDSNRHMLKDSKPKPPKDPHRVETRGRPRGPNYDKRAKRPGIGRGHNLRADIPRQLVVQLKRDGLSGREVAKELERRGYGNVSKDYANRKLREAGVLLDSQQSGGRPRKGE